MYQKSKIYFLGFISILLMHACSSDNQWEHITTNDSDKISFASAIDNSSFGGVNTRAVNSEWQAKDNIGVFMFKDGKELGESTILEGTNNHLFTTTGDGFFMTPLGEEIYFPKDEKKVSFIAYYPYTKELNAFARDINVADQSKPAEINLMYSDNLKGNDSNASRMLQFKHMLSRVQFDIKAEQNVNLATLAIEVNNVPVKASLNLVNGSLKIDNTSTQASVAAYRESDKRFSAFLLPTASTNLKFTITIKGKTIVKTIKTADLNAGKQNVITLALSDSGGEIVPSKGGWAETPQFTAAAGQEYVTYNMPQSVNLAGVKKTYNFTPKDRNYSMLYDKNERIALWIAYPLHDSHIGDSGRSEWSYAPNITQTSQPNVVGGAWQDKTLGCDRGHQIASGDRTIAAEVNAMTFYTTNATVQKISLNGGVWEGLESALQGKVKTNSDTIYIVTGVTLTSKEITQKQYTYDRSNRDVAIPAAYYKAIYRKVNGKDETYGYYFPNVETEQTKNFNQPKYMRSVSELEKETGYVFFPHVDRAVKDKTVAFN